MISEDFFFKMKCLELAGKEELQETMVMDSKRLFDRAQDLYSQGHIAGISEWSSPFNKELKKKVIKKEIDKDVVKEKVVAKEGFKICPQCDEEVKVGFNIHRYKKNGENCGYKF